VLRGRTIEAIKAIRTRYGYGLQQAKQHFDAIRTRQAGR
jgi:ribosomal protein L7/L12